MKKISKVDLESMRRELTVLDEVSMKKVKGGYTNSYWGCVFNAMEYAAYMYGASYEDENYKTDLNYYEDYYWRHQNDPGFRNPSSLVDPNNIGSGYVGIGTDQVEDAFKEAGFNIRNVTDFSSLSGEAMMIIPNAQGGYHTVFPKRVNSSGQIEYWDPTSGNPGIYTGDMQKTTIFDVSM